MSETLAKWMTAIITITIMFTPILAYLDALHRSAVEEVLHEYSKKASIVGGYTPDMVDEMKDALHDRYNFDLTKIEIETTSTSPLRYRPTPGETISEEHYIKAKITVPRTPIFIIDIFNQGPTTFSKEISIMSELVGS